MLAYNQLTGEEEEAHLEEVDIKHFGTNDAGKMVGDAYDSDDESGGGQQKVQCRQVSEMMLHTCILGAATTFISFNDDLTSIKFPLDVRW